MGNRKADSFGTEAERRFVHTTERLIASGQKQKDASCTQRKVSEMDLSPTCSNIPQSNLSHSSTPKNPLAPTMAHYNSLITNDSKIVEHYHRCYQELHKHEACRVTQ